MKCIRIPNNAAWLSVSHLTNPFAMRSANFLLTFDQKSQRTKVNDEPDKNSDFWDSDHEEDDRFEPTSALHDNYRFLTKVFLK